MIHYFCFGVFQTFSGPAGWVCNLKADMQSEHVSVRSFFGAKVVPPQLVMKALPKLFETKDGKARDKVKDVVVRPGDHACVGHL